MAKSKIRAIEEDEYGLYIWVDDQGRRVANEDNETMNIPSRKGDREKIRALRDAARYYGVQGGRAVFLSGRRRVTNDEWEEQNARFRAGLVPDPMDYNAMAEEAKYAKRYNQ